MVSNLDKNLLSILNLKVKTESDNVYLLVKIKAFLYSFILQQSDVIKRQRNNGIFKVNDRQKKKGKKVGEKEQKEEGGKTSKENE